MRPTLARAAIYLIAALSCSAVQAQYETPGSVDNIPPASRDGVVPPDRVLYGAFLRHEAVFERRARENEAKGLSGAAYRNHFINHFGITANEQLEISAIALSFYDQWAGLKAQVRAAVADFHKEFFTQSTAAHVTGQEQASSGTQFSYPTGTTLPSAPGALASLDQQIEALTLSARDQVHASLGDARFQHLDATLRARAAHDFQKVWDLREGGK